ncbi:hypothetical protein SUGI_0685130 [Cryptomeria japonica]|nr:hypothetical protein SUGI_0685130 [Cryptomeria japonica]
MQQRKEIAVAHDLSRSEPPACELGKCDVQQRWRNSFVSLVQYPNATAFKENLNNAFLLLAINISSTAFATASNGNGIDGVYGLTQCRNGLSKENCSTCYAAAKDQILTYYPVDRGATTAFDGWFLRYGNFTFFDQAIDGGYSSMCTSDASARPILFNETAHRLLADVRSKALTNEGFATDEISAKGLSTASYGLAMCRQTLTTNSCDDGRGLDAGCYLRYSTLPFFTAPSSSSSPSKIVPILVGILGGAALIAILCLLFMFRHSIRNLYSKLFETVEYFIAEEEPTWDHLFSYDSIRAATKNFDPNMKIGEGGFGQVFKAKFKDAQEVAVKKLTRALDGFDNEDRLISAVRHPNLVPNTAEPLGWITRFGIILGTARGLAHLNEERPDRILHRDIKAANILLDNDCNALSRRPTHLTARGGGTIGYIAPEYALRGQLTEKVDVYSYGILVLEIVSGRKGMDSALPEFLLEWAWNLYDKNEAFSVVDPRLIEEERELNREEILKIIQIAFLCTQGAPELRPSLMSKVVSMLTSNTQILAQPNRPAFIDNKSRSNGFVSLNMEGMESPSVASHAPVSNSLEPR